MRYIADTDGYVKQVSFGADIFCDNDTCTEYTGAVPSGYTSLEAWFCSEVEKLYRWKIVDGNLTLDSTAVAPFEGNDSGWITPTLTSQFEAYVTEQTPKYRKVGNTVEVVGVVKATATITSNVTRHTIFTLPEGYRPSIDVNVICQGSTMAVWLLTISATTGDVTFSRYRLGDAYANIGTTVWLPFQAMFFAGGGEAPETTMTATHDGAGNVTVYGATATHDGAGNVTIL